MGPLLTQIVNPISPKKVLTSLYNLKLQIGHVIYTCHHARSLQCIFFDVYKLFFLNCNSHFYEIKIEFVKNADHADYNYIVVSGFIITVYSILNWNY